MLSAELQARAEDFARAFLARLTHIGSWFRSVLLPSERDVSHALGKQSLAGIWQVVSDGQGASQGLEAMIGNSGQQGGLVGEVPIGVLTLCFQHIEGCRDQRFSKPNQRAHLA